MWCSFVVGTSSRGAFHSQVIGFSSVSTIPFEAADPLCAKSVRDDAGHKSVIFMDMVRHALVSLISFCPRLTFKSVTDETRTPREWQTRDTSSEFPTLSTPQHTAALDQRDADLERVRPFGACFVTNWFAALFFWLSNG